MVGIGEWITEQAALQGTTTEEVKRGIVEGALALRRRQKAAEEYVPGIPIRAELPPEIPPLIQFIAPGATYDRSQEIIAELQRIQLISPIAAFIEPAAGLERQIEITEILVPYAGTGPGLLPPGVELPKLPDILGGAKNAIIIGAVALGGLFLLSRFIGRKK